MTQAAGGQVASRPTVKVDNAVLQQRVAGALRHAAVDTDAAGPDSCRLMFDDPARNLLSGSGFEIAAALSLTAGRVGEDAGDTIFSGVVYALGFEYDERGAFTTVTAYDRSYGLYNGLHTKTYQDVTDSDLATQIAKEVGLDIGSIESTPVLHKYVSQMNETHFEFLSRRAREVDCQLRVTGSQLNLVASTDSGDAPAPGDFDTRDRLQLVAGGNLQRLVVRVSAAGQVGEVEARGWDPATKQAVTATAQAGSRTAELADTPSTVAKLFGSPRYVSVGTPLHQQAECDAMASARAQHLGSTCVHAEGVAYGDPRILAGTAVSLGSTGGRFDGKVTVTRARHVWDGQGYRTTFVASGSNDRSVLGLVDRDRSERARHQVGGLVVGIVTNVADPDKVARVKVRFPWLDDEYESDWVRVLQLGGGADRGLQLLPEVEDEVLVGFEHGDTRRPYVLGGLYNGVDGPPRPGAVDSGAGKVNTRIWRSRTGHEVVLDDTSGSESVTIKAGGEKVSIVLDTASKGLTIHAEGDVTVNAKGKAAVNAQGDLTIEAKGNATVKAGQSLKLEGGTDVTVKGTTIKLN